MYTSISGSRGKSARRLLIRLRGWIAQTREIQRARHDESIRSRRLDNVVLTGAQRFSKSISVHESRRFLRAHLTEARRNESYAPRRSWRRRTVPEK